MARLLTLLFAVLGAGSALAQQPALQPKDLGKSEDFLQQPKPHLDPGKPQPPASGPIVAACFSPDGKWFLTADFLCRVSLWRADADKPDWTVQTTTETFTWAVYKVPYSPLGLAFAADGKRALVAWGLAVAEIDRGTGKVVRTTKLPGPAATQGGDTSPRVAFLPGSDECVYHGRFGEDARLVRFDFKAQKRHPKFDMLLSRHDLRVVVSPDGKRVLACGNGFFLGEWELDTGELCKLFGGLGEKVGDAGYTPDGEKVWVHLEPFTVLDRTSGKRVAQPGVLGKYAGWVGLAPDGKRGLGQPWGGGKDLLDVIRVSDGEVLRRFSSEGLFFEKRKPWDDTNDEWSPNPGVVAFAPDGKTVLLTAGDGPKGAARLGIWELDTGKRLRTLTHKP
ncbi:MAG: WD40 repeat domain-containing protein [Gemmataceae bacterium]|nr:WD40 repeat domain-containing protein [Gemmataceae bacterium]